MTSRALRKTCCSIMTLEEGQALKCQTSATSFARRSLNYWILYYLLLKTKIPQWKRPRFIFFMHVAIVKSLLAFYNPCNADVCLNRIQFFLFSNYSIHNSYTYIMWKYFNMPIASPLIEKNNLHVIFKYCTECLTYLYLPDSWQS